MLCASQASTRNICSTMDQPSQPSSSSTIRLGGRAIDRHNPIIRDGRRFTPPPSPNHSASSVPSSSSSTYHTPLKTRLGLESSEPTRVTKRKSKKSQCDAGKSPISCFTSDTPQGSSRYLLSNPVFFDGFVDSDPIPIPIEPEITTADDLDKTHEDRLVINASKHLPSSTSFLEKKVPDFFDGFLDYDPVMSPNNPFSEPTKASPTSSQNSLEDKDVSSPDNPFTEPTKASPTASHSSLEDKDISSPDIKFSPPQPPPPPPPPSPPQTETNSSSDQVVVLRVSLHCKGCAGKVKKHLSKLKGVTSFNIDFAAKKVTVTGDVTPLAVLASISKVKNAQVWPQTIQK